MSWAEAVAQLDQQLSPAQVDQLQRWLAMVDEETARLDLTGLRDPEERALELVVDSLAAAPLLPAAGRVADLGSGAGVPGIPLAIARPDVAFTLVESSKKKSEFLRRVAAELGIEDQVAVWHGRAEEAGRDPALRERFQAVVCRALAPLVVLVELALPLLCDGGELLAHKGPQAPEEEERAAFAIGELKGALEPRVPYAFEGRQRAVVRVRKAGPTPGRYPRRTGLPSKRPLLG